MEWIFDNFQIVLLVGLALVSLIKRAADQKMAEREERDAPRDSTDDEDWRDPEPQWHPPAAPSVPPPLTRQVVPPPLTRQVPPPIQQAASPPPLVAREAESAAVFQRQLEIQQRLKDIKQAKAITRGGAAATRSRLAEAGKARSTLQARPSISAALRNRSELRRAVILREILGPPVGLPK